MSKLPIIGITIGDLAGVGPEIISEVISSRSVHKICIPVVIGNPNEIKVVPGKVSAAAGEYSMKCVRDAVSMAMQGNLDAIVTAPISKEAIHKAGYKFSGHTDYLAYLTKTKEYSMMFVSRNIKVILVTIHLPLSAVPCKITKKAVVRAIKHAGFAGKLLGMKKPRIAVCALNPHGSETGGEEKRIIIPAIKGCGVNNVKGPFPADTLFYKVNQKEYDIVVAMYHDQGLIPFKMTEFMEGVNVTLGLPFIRTSPDHGTAYDITGSGKADPTSMIRAIELAVVMSKR